jgi:hypothetical protein
MFHIRIVRRARMSVPECGGMPRETLLDFFYDFATLDDEFFIYDDGFQARSYRYRGIAGRGSDRLSLVARICRANQEHRHGANDSDRR